MAELVVGIDGGGTKTRVECYDAGSFQFVGSGTGGACNIAALPISDAMTSVEDALTSAGAQFAQVVAVCAAVAGYSHDARRLEFTAALSRLLPQARLNVIPDYEAAFRSALPHGSGVLVVAGTGSIAYARNEQGIAARAGGYGYLIDDAGSGYGVGRQALAAALAMQDGLGEATVLGEQIARALGWPDLALPRDAVIREVYFGTLNRARIASLAQVAAEAASGGDDVARRILMHAGGALARLAYATCRRVFTERSQAIPVARAGSLWQAGTALTDVFERSLARFAPAALFAQLAEREPAWGAARIALESLGGRR